MRFQFVHIPKTGGVAFSEFLKSHYSETFDVMTPHHEFCLQYCENPIVVIRNPLERVSSIYQFWNKGSEIFDEKRFLTFDEFLDGAEEVIGATEDKHNLKDVIESTYKMSVPFLALPQSKWLGSDDYYKTIVVKYSRDLNESICLLLEHLQVCQVHSKINGINVTKDKKEMEFSSEQMKKIFKLYYADFSLWHEINNNTERFRLVCSK